MHWKLLTANRKKLVTYNTQQEKGRKARYLFSAVCYLDLREIIVRFISISRLNPSLGVHLRPINLVIFQETGRSYHAARDTR